MLFNRNRAKYFDGLCDSSVFHKLFPGTGAVDESSLSLSAAFDCAGRRSDVAAVTGVCTEVL